MGRRLEPAPLGYALMPKKAATHVPLPHSDFTACGRGKTSVLLINTKSANEHVPGGKARGFD